VPAAEYLFFQMALASEPKRSERYKKHAPIETDALASTPNKPDASASGRNDKPRVDTDNNRYQGSFGG
jgi:hypothetical protein